VDESRKRVIGVMAAILAARKLARYDGGKRVPATVAAIADAFDGLRRSWARLTGVGSQISNDLTAACCEAASKDLRLLTVRDSER